MKNVMLRNLIILAFLMLGSFISKAEKDRTAQWITSLHVKNEANTWICFRKEADISKVPDKAVASIAADSKYWLWINGEMIVFEGGLKRGPSPGIHIVSEVDVPGHSKAVLAAYPEVSCSGKPTTVSAGTNSGIGENVFCVGNEQNFKMQNAVFGEITDLFPGEYLHIGGDKANRKFWKNCPKCQQRMNDEHLKNSPKLQSYFSR